MIASFVFALAACLVWALARIAATSFEQAFYHRTNGDRRAVWRALRRALWCVLLVSFIVRPVFDFVRSFDVVTVEQPTVKERPSGMLI